MMHDKIPRVPRDLTKPREPREVSIEAIHWMLSLRRWQLHIRFKGGTTATVDKAFATNGRIKIHCSKTDQWIWLSGKFRIELSEKTPSKL